MDGELLEVSEYARLATERGSEGAIVLALDDCSLFLLPSRDHRVFHVRLLVAEEVVEPLGVLGKGFVLQFAMVVL